MPNKKVIWIFILLAALLSMSSISASDNLTDNINNDTLAAFDNSMDFINVDDNEVSSVSSKTFTDLFNLINDNDDSRVILEQNYAFSMQSDSDLINGIPISKSISIQGNGFTIDGANQARIFNLTNYVAIYNVTFANANADSGAAITGTNYAIYDSTFVNNHAAKSGGALYNAYVERCTFINNSAGRLGGAMYNGQAIDCTFKNNSANDGGAIYYVYARNCEFVNNYAGSSCGAMYGSSASGCRFVGNSARDHSGAFGFGSAFDCIFINNSAQQSGAMGGSSSANDCTFIGNSADEGGAMFGCEADNCLFTKNHANQGGAMAGGGQAINCNFTSNSADTYGGALLEVYAWKCMFSNNYAYQGGALVGGKGALSCLFSNNSAINGGAAYNVYVSNCNFTYNNAKLGGAIYEGFASQSIFRYNSAKNGGAIYFNGVSSEYAADASVFISNVADEYGGALYGTSAGNCYFKSNSAKFGGAISSNSSASGSTFIGNIAKVSGGAKFESYVSGCTFEGNLPAYTLYASDFSSIEGFGGNIIVKLFDSPDYQVIGENVTIKVVNNKNAIVGTYKAQTGFNWFVDFPIGSYKASISVDNNEIYCVDPIKVSITIQKSSFIYVVGVTTNYNAGKSLIINLHDSVGNVIKYAKISVSMNGLITTYSTNANGQVIISTNGLVPNTYDVIVSYAGSSLYVKSSVSTKIVVKKLNPILTAAKKTFKLKDKTKKYAVTLKTNKKVAMINCKVKIVANGRVYFAKTNSKGIATFKLKKLNKKGNFKSYISFEGNQYYNAVTKSAVLKVKK